MCPFKVLFYSNRPIRFVIPAKAGIHLWYRNSGFLLAQE